MLRPRLQRNHHVSQAPRLLFGQSTPRGPAPSGNGCVDPSTPEKSAESLLALQSPPSSSWSSGPLATAFYQGSSSLSSTARDAGVRPAGPLPISTARGDRHDSQTGLTPRLSDFALSGGQWGPGPPRSLPIPDVRPPKRGVSEAAVPAVQRSATSAPSLARPGLLPALSAYEAAQRFGHLLTPFEREEVHRFQKIWFVGRPGTAKLTAGHLPSLDAPPVFADERGNYMAVVGDHIAYRYEVQSVLGQGSFGQVLRCADHAVGGRPVALKIMRGKRRFQKQALVETKILSLLQGAQVGRRREVLGEGEETRARGLFEDAKSLAFWRCGLYINEYFTYPSHPSTPSPPPPPPPAPLPGIVPRRGLVARVLLLPWPPLHRL